MRTYHARTYEEFRTIVAAIVRPSDSLTAFRRLPNRFATPARESEFEDLRI
jgi:hypothetical protein